MSTGSLDSAHAIELAVQFLREGNVVGLPTETVYGLAAKISDDQAIRKIFSTKDRPFFDPLIVHVGSIEQARTLTSEWPEAAQLLAEQFWPGPLTLVLPKKTSVSDLITSGLDTVAIRFPRHPVARKVIEDLGEPVAAPSANRFGRTSPSTAEHVRQEFASQVFVVEGGPCEVGIESTIVKISESETAIQLTLLRAGSILPEQLHSSLRVISKNIQILQPGRNIEAPGQVQHHYMPSIPLMVIDRQQWDDANKSLDQLNHFLQTQFTTPCLLHLSPSPEQAARELYRELRLSSKAPNDVIIFIREFFHKGDPWAAILDRLMRAATFHLVRSEPTNPAIDD